MGTVRAWINPLICTEIDLKHDDVTAQVILDYLLAPESAGTVESFRSRYLELKSQAAVLPLAPAEESILQKIIWPLRSARGSYALGHSLSCIAMAGMVGEMVAVLLWDIAKPPAYHPLSEEQERQLLGRTFERLGQERRIDVLLALSVIAEEQAKMFQDLKAIRNRYLHFLSQDHAALDADARRAFELAARLVQILFVFRFEKGDVMLRPELSKYLEEIGVANP